MKIYKSVTLCILFFCFILVSACGISPTPVTNSPQINNDSTAAVLSYSLNGTHGIISGKSIAVTMPYNTDVSHYSFLVFNQKRLSTKKILDFSALVDKIK